MSFLYASLLDLKFHLYVQFDCVYVILVLHNGNKISPFVMEFWSRCLNMYYFFYYYFFKKELFYLVLVSSNKFW